jgi:hypothetical protein
MKITSTIMAILMGCAVLVFNACNNNSNSKDKSKELLMLAVCSGVGSTYTIGETGPGDGIVFYDKGSYSGDGDGCWRYLEAAPVDQSTGETWSTILDAYANGSSALPTAIGRGAANTDAIIKQNSGAASAAETCRSYTGGGKTDWFLPSKDELNQLYLNRATVGGFTADYYWSSSELGSCNCNSVAWDQMFDVGGNQITSGKTLTRLVRAVRAF